MKIIVQSFNNLILLFLSVHFSNSIFTQVEIDKPILELKENCTFSCIVEVDSSNWIYTSINVKSIDMYNDTKPGEYSVNMYQSTPHKYYHYFIIDSIYSVIISNIGIIPQSCRYKIKKPDGMYAVSYTIDYDSSKNKIVGIYSELDSIIQTDYNCLYQFYNIENDSILVDTFLTKKPISVESSNEIKIWSCQYFYHMKHGVEIRYYDISELKEVNLNGKFPGLMFVGNWRYGLKHGLWQYFDKTGNLIRVEKYRNGKLIKFDTRKLLKKEADIKTEY